MGDKCFSPSWCAPCRSLIPALRSIYKQYKRTELEIISIDNDVSAWMTALNVENMNCLIQLPRLRFNERYFLITTIHLLILLTSSRNLIDNKIRMTELVDLLKLNSIYIANLKDYIES